MTALVFGLLCVLANGFFVAAEFSLAKVRPSALDARARRGDHAAARALRLARQLEIFLPATQLGITFASLGLGWVGEPALAQLLAGPLGAVGFSPEVVHGVALGIAFSVLSLLHIVVGELVPKSLAIQRSERLATFSAPILIGFYWLTYPALVVLNVLSRWTLRAVGLPSMEHAEGKLSEEEIRLIIKASFGAGDEVDRKRDLLDRVLRGTDRPVRAVMIPRVDMTVLPQDADAGTVLATLKKQGFSRYPICTDGDPDKVLGYVHVKDALLVADHPETPLDGFRRDVLFVPSGRTVGDLLSEFQLTRTPIAIVVDEYGGTSGMVTMEDVVEELVGEIQDEHDEEQPRIVTHEDGTVVVDGTLPLDELSLPGFARAAVEGADTIGGHVVAALGRLARPGDRVRLGAWDALVLEVRRRRVLRIRLLPRPASEPPPPVGEPAADTE